MKTFSPTQVISSCGICNNTQLETLWNLPQFPFTEKYGKYDQEKNRPIDQKLCFCSGCGHVQLGVQVHPEILYSSTEYSFRVDQSVTAQSGTQFFLEFFNKLVQNKKFNSLVDIGGNGLFLANHLQSRAANRCVIDPICDKQDGDVIDGVKIIGKFIEESDLSQDLIPPDLIFCRHVLEHISKPRDLLEKLFSECDSDALYVFEIPCFDNLVEANRFDAIFHQHYHYYTLDSFKNLIDESGGEYVAHEYNHQGSCGGALLIAFKKALRKSPSVKLNIQVKKRHILNSIRNYDKYCQVVSDHLRQFNKNIYGYGASLMLATLGYHLKTDFSELICIIDDDPCKNDMGYENIPVTIKNKTGVSLPKQSNFIITSLENTRVIFKKIMELQPKRVIIPFIA